MVTPIQRDGKIVYYHTAWADDEFGEEFSITEPEDGAIMIGHYIDSNSSESTDYNKYKWEFMDETVYIYEDTDPELIENNVIEEDQVEEDGDNEDDSIGSIEELQMAISNNATNDTTNQTFNSDGIGNPNELALTNKGVEGWSGQGLTFEELDTTIYSETEAKVRAVRITGSGKASFVAVHLCEELALSVDTEDSDAYTLTMDVRMSNVFEIPDIKMQDQDGSNQQIIFDEIEPESALEEDEESLNDVWHHYISTAQAEGIQVSNQSLVFDLSGNTGTVDIANLKVEKGAVETRWRRSVEEVEKAAEEASQTAAEAKTVAKATNQHFWADDVGVHISNEVDNEGNGKPDGEKNSLWNSLGMLFRKGVNNIVAILAGDTPSTRGMAIYDGVGNAEENVIAKFTGEGAKIGKINGLSCMDITPRNMQLTAYNESYTSRQHIIDIGVLNNPDTGGYNVRIKPTIRLEEYPSGSGNRYATIVLSSSCLPNSVQLFKKEPISTVVTGVPLTLDPSKHMYIITDNEGVPHPDDTIGENNMLFHMVSFPKSHFESHPIDLESDIYIQTNTQVTLNNGTVIPAGTKKPLFNIFYWTDFYEGLDEYLYCIEDDTFELIQKGQTDLIPYANETNEVPYNTLPFEYTPDNLAIVFVGVTDKNDPRLKAISSVTYDSTFLRPYFTYGYRKPSAPIGLYSISLGDRNTAEDDFTTAIGCENTVEGEYGTTIGSWNSISGQDDFIFGFSNDITKNDSCIIGTGNSISKQNGVFMIGTGLTDGGKNVKVAPYATILGVGNKPVSNSVFQVGVGKDKRKNAMNLSPEGRLTLGDHNSWVGKVEHASKKVTITSSLVGMDKKVVGASKTLGAGVWVITAYACFYTGTGSGTRGIDISLRRSDDVLRHTRVYNANQNWAELNLTYVANISKSTTFYVCKSATTAEKQADSTVFHAVRIF